MRTKSARVSAYCMHTIAVCVVHCIGYSIEMRHLACAIHVQCSFVRVLEASHVDRMLVLTL